MVNNLQIHLSKYFDNYSGLPPACWGAVALTFIQSVASGMCYFVSLYFVGELHVDIATSGMMLSCYGAGTVCGGVLSGKLCDRFSPREISFICLLMEAISFAFIARFSSYKLLMIVMFILGLAAYGFKTSNDVWMLGQCVENQALRMKAINLSRVAMNLGLGVSGVIIGLFAEYGFINIFYLFAFFLLMAAVYVAIQKRENVSLADSTSPEDTFQTSNYRVLLVALFSLFCVGLMIAQLGSTYPVYLLDAFPAWGVKAVSVLYLLDTFLIVFAQAPLTNAFGKYNKMIVMGIGAFLMGVGMLVLSVSTIFALAIVSCIIWTTGEMLFIPMSQLLCYENGGAKKRGQAMGVYQAIYASSAIIGPTVGGFIYHHAGGNVVWYLCGLLGTVCLVLCLWQARSSWSYSRFYADTATQKGGVASKGGGIALAGGE